MILMEPQPRALPGHTLRPHGTRAALRQGTQRPVLGIAGFVEWHDCIILHWHCSYVPFVWFIGMFISWCPFSNIMPDQRVETWCDDVHSDYVLLVSDSSSLHWRPCSSKCLTLCPEITACWSLPGIMASRMYCRNLLGFTQWSSSSVPLAVCTISCIQSYYVVLICNVFICIHYIHDSYIAVLIHCTLLSIFDVLLFGPAGVTSHGDPLGLQDAPANPFDVFSVSELLDQFAYHSRVKRERRTGKKIVPWLLFVTGMFRGLSMPKRSEQRLIIN